MNFVDHSIKTNVLMFPVIRRMEVADVKTIVRIEIINGHSMICFTNGRRFLSSKVLKWFEEQLPSALFVRVHRTHLVNKKFICRYNKHSKQIGLSNGESVDVSRRKKAKFLRVWKTAWTCWTKYKFLNLCINQKLKAPYERGFEILVLLKSCLRWLLDLFKHFFYCSFQLRIFSL